VLVEASIEDDKPTAKESTATPKKPVNAKKNKSVVSIEDSLSTRKSMRLSVIMKKIAGKGKAPFLRMYLFGRVNQYENIISAIYTGF
jgi:hypothetical protein